MASSMQQALDEAAQKSGGPKHGPSTITKHPEVDKGASKSGNGATDHMTPPPSPSLNLSRPKVPVVVDNQTIELIRDAKAQIPDIVGGKEGWVTTLLTILTLEDPDARAQQATLEAEARAELARYAKGDLGDWLNPDQKSDMGKLAQVAIMNKFASDTPEEFPILLAIMKMAEEWGIVCRASKDEDLTRLRGRVVRAGNIAYTSNLSVEGSTPWVALLNEKWENVSRQNFADHKSAEKAIRQKADGTVVEMLAGKDGTFAVTVPDSSFVVRSTKERRFSAGGIILLQSIEGFLSPIEAVGKLAKRFEQIVDPSNERGFRLGHNVDARDKPVRRGFKVEEVAVLDPRRYQGTEEEVTELVAKNQMPRVKRASGESEEDSLQRIADRGRLWGALVHGISRTLGSEAHIAMLKQEQAGLAKKGDVDARDHFASDKPGRTVVFLKGAWHEGDKHYSRPIFAVKRNKDGQLSFEWPARLDPLYVGVEKGKLYSPDALPAPLDRQLAKAGRILTERAENDSTDEAEAATAMA